MQKKSFWWFQHILPVSIVPPHPPTLMFLGSVREPINRYLGSIHGSPLSLYLPNLQVLLHHSPQYSLTLSFLFPCRHCPSLGPLICCLISVMLLDWPLCLQSSPIYCNWSIFWKDTSDNQWPLVIFRIYSMLFSGTYIGSGSQRRPWSQALGFKRWLLSSSLCYLE